MQRISALLFCSLLISGCACSTHAPQQDGSRVSTPIMVSKLAADGEFVPVTAAIDLSAIARKLGVCGAVDERSLRLFRVHNDGSEQEEPYQFSAADQPRPAQPRFVPGTPNTVSYVGEYAAGADPDNIKVAGQLSWIVRRPAEGRARYRLEFAIPNSGTLVQVPYPPQNLVTFDIQGNARAPRWFPTLQVHPQSPIDGVLHLSENQRLVTTYHIGPTLDQLKLGTASVRRPFFYPLIGPDNIALTEMGKPHDPTASHAHHYSVFDAGRGDRLLAGGKLLLHFFRPHAGQQPVAASPVNVLGKVIGDAKRFDAVRSGATVLIEAI